MPAEDLLRTAAAAAGIAIDGRGLDRLRTYLDTLLRWRERLALVSQRTSEAIIAKHFRDSMQVVPFIPEPSRVADFGSGGGFPGIVVGLLCERAEVTLVESQRRKASFLRDVVRQTGASNLQVLEARAESVAETERPFDVVLSRAVWPGMYFLEVAAPVLRPGGLAIAMKTPSDMPEETAIGYENLEIQRYQLDGSEERALVLARRRRSTVSRET